MFRFAYSQLAAWLVPSPKESLEEYLYRREQEQLQKTTGQRIYEISRALVDLSAWEQTIVLTASLRDIMPPETLEHLSNRIGQMAHEMQRH